MEILIIDDFPNEFWQTGRELRTQLVKAREEGKYEIIKHDKL